jgi:hypothetical protein
MKLKSIVLAVVAAALACSSRVSAQALEGDALRLELKDNVPAGEWFYDDIDAAVAEARNAGKPLLVVFR